MKINPVVPDFIIPGFAKSGTSSLHEYLNQHPNIQMSTIKEPHNYSKMEHYEQRFNPAFPFSFPTIFNAIDKKKDVLLGESSTSYAICDYAPKLIYQDNPNMKFIFIARDPIERIKSHYNWLLSLGDVQKNFRSEIKDWLTKEFDINNPVKHGYKYYTDSSFYGKQLKNYLNYFNIEQFHFLSTENLKNNPKEELKKCFQFLNVENYPNIISVKTNQTKPLKIKYEIPKQLTFFKNVLPLSVKTSLKNVFGKKYIIPNKNNPIKDLNHNDVAWLTNILQEDIQLFKKLTNNNFEEWKYF